MSDAATLHHPEPAESPLTPESWGKLGMWIFLCGDAMTFGTLIVTFGIMRIAAADWPVPSEVLGVNLTAFMTFLLICSSVTMVLSLSGIKRGNMQEFKKFMLLTILGGTAFLACQAYEWTHLIHEGVTITANKYGSPVFGDTFYIMTGFHGMHVFGGVVYLIVIFVGGLTGRITQANASVVEIAGLYWHFVDLVWILIFTFVYLL
ncbi:MAG: cytochrome c oxidase subunit 3 [Deltaproteobacteria bacterium]|nr:cytochrome c oxidase subunit 3 [Deltaproteobacteria bacterium]